MSSEYKKGVFVGIILGIVVYFLVVFALPILGKLTWLFT